MSGLPVGKEGPYAHFAVCVMAFFFYDVFVFYESLGRVRSVRTFLRAWANIAKEQVVECGTGLSQWLCVGLGEVGRRVGLVWTKIGSTSGSAGQASAAAAGV